MPDCNLVIGKVNEYKWRLGSLDYCWERTLKITKLGWSKSVISIVEVKNTLPEQDYMDPQGWESGVKLPVHPVISALIGSCKSQQPQLLIQTFKPLK